MANKVVLVAESLQEWEKLQTKEVLNEELQQLNEGAKGLLQKFLKNPEKSDRFVSAFAKQINKVKGLKNAVEKLDTDTKVKLAQQALKALEDPKKGYPWFKIVNNKIAGAGALGVQKSDLGKELGQ
jgi:pantoate kinase